MATGYWRDSARTPRFFYIDGWAAFPLLLFLLHIRIWTFITAVFFTMFFSALERYGFGMKVFFRWLRGVLGGRRKVADPWWQ